MPVGVYKEWTRDIFVKSGSDSDDPVFAMWEDGFEHPIVDVVCDEWMLAMKSDKVIAEKKLAEKKAKVVQSGTGKADKTSCNTLWSGAMVGNADKLIVTIRKDRKLADGNQVKLASIQIKEGKSWKQLAQAPLHKTSPMESTICDAMIKVAMEYSRGSAPTTRLNRRDTMLKECGMAATADVAKATDSAKKAASTKPTCSTKMAELARPVPSMKRPAAATSEPEPKLKQTRDGQTDDSVRS